MIITKTPFRLSFFGGGTDYPAHYLEHGGAVLASSINKYCYISCRILPPFFDHKYRIAYSKIENAQNINEIEHPSVKAVLSYVNHDMGLEIHHDGDLPARSGLGSSSSFTVGLLSAIHALNRRMVSKYELAMQAIEVEQNVIGEKVGSQDQVLAAMGGFNLVQFNQDGAITVNPVIMSPERKTDLNNHLLLFFSGVTRNSQTITPQKISDIKNKKNDLFEMRNMVDEGLKIISSEERDICDFGRLMHESWMLKRSISSNISTDLIDDMYTTATNNGALGGKLLGAGGGGFIAFFAPPERHEKIKRALSSYIHVPFRFDNDGSTVCVYEPNGF